MDWLEILDVLLVAIPLVVALVKFINKAAKEKNWIALVSLVIELIAEAEDQFDKGSDRKTWVLGMVETGAEEIGYNFDAKRIGKLIDDICRMSKKVNTSKE